jgi:hypothetical protein
MRKYDYQKMTKALTFTETGETRELLVLLEMDWSHAQVLQFFRERDKWRETSVVSVKPVTVTTKEDEPPVHRVMETTETVPDQIPVQEIKLPPPTAKKKP